MPVTTDTSTSILIGLTLLPKGEGCVSKIYDTEAAFIHPYMTVEMFIEWPEVTVDLGITTKEFLEEYCILLGKSMYGNVDAVLLWLRLLAKYLIKK